MMADLSSELPELRIDLATTPDFDLGDLRVRPARRQVFRGNALYRELEPRVMQVLIALASARGEVVSRDRLVEVCWDGRIVGNDAINRCIVALRHLARQVAPQPFAIATVARVGYYLVEGEEATGPSPAGPPRRLVSRRAQAALVAGVIALALFRFACTRVTGRRGC